MPDSKSRVLAIDQGTQSTRALLFDTAGNRVAAARCTIALERIDRWHVEQDGREILASVLHVMSELRDAASAGAIAAAGLATQRSSVIAWNRKSGEPLSPVLSWQDRREHAWLQGLQPKAREIQQITGLRLTPHYGASKLRWLLRHDSRVQQAAGNGTLAMGPLAAFLVANLVEAHPCLVDHANASRTQLWNLQTAQWDMRLLAWFDLERQWLPEVRPIRSDYGMLCGTSIPLKAVNGDQTAALFAQGALRPSELHVNLGTGGFVLKPTGDRPVMHDALLAGPCDSSDGERSFLIEGTVNGAGAALRWAQKSRGFATSPDTVARCLASCPAPEVLFMNSIGGLGSPWWRDGPAPHWCDLEGGRVETPREAVAVAAVIESVLFLVTGNVRAMLDAGLAADGILISGGLSNHDPLCRKLAALTGLPVRRMHQPEATARGIAWLAQGRPAGWGGGNEAHLFLPQTDSALQQRYNRFVAILERHA